MQILVLETKISRTKNPVTGLSKVIHSDFRIACRGLYKFGEVVWTAEVYRPNMDSMLSDSTLGIPKKVVAILAANDGKPYSKVVWTLAKHTSGYSLKLFWGVEQKSALKYPNSTHPSFSGRSNRNRHMLDAFLVKKRAESSSQHSLSLLEPVTFQVFLRHPLTLKFALLKRPWLWIFFSWLWSFLYQGWIYFIEGTCKWNFRHYH